MFRMSEHIGRPAVLEVRVSDIDVAVPAFEADVARPELTAVESPVVVVETDEHGPASAMIEQAVVERGFGECVGVVFGGEQPGLGEIAEGEVLMEHLGFKTACREMMKPDRRLALTREVQPDDLFILEQRYHTRELKLITCVPEGTYRRRGVIVAQLKDVSGDPHTLIE